MPASRTAYLYMTRAQEGEHNTEHNSIKSKGRKDQDIIIDLVTDVNYIVLRVKALNMERMLIVHSDFLSHIYRVLPSPSQEKWLEFKMDIHTSKWKAFIKFPDQARDKALQSKVLLSSYNSEEVEKFSCKKCGSSSHRANNFTDGKANFATVADEDSDEDIEKKSRKLKKNQKDECGKCPLCSKNHTYIRWKV
jgi:DNA-directed RNA polymerase subunit M/transcription elongation factor TFIIS